MKTKKTNQILLAACFAAAVLFNSCKKEDATMVKKEDTYAAKVAAFKKVSQYQLAANAAELKLSTLIQNLVASTKLHGKKEDGFACAIVTIDSSSSPRIATFDFGPTGCTDSSGKFYSGSIVVAYTDFTQPGGYLNATASNFTVDTLNFDGTFNYTNTGTNGNGNPSGTISSNMTTNFVRDRVKLTGTLDVTFEWVSSRSASYFTLTSNGTDADGLVFSQSTNAPIAYKSASGCTDHFVSGKLLIQSPSLPDEEIDYGNGACDDQATSTIGGITTPFTLQ